MARGPQYKVYDPNGVYQAACKEAEAAAALVALYGEGSTVKLDHANVLYREDERLLATESYDQVATQITLAHHRVNVEYYEKVNGKGSYAEVLRKNREAGS